LEYIPQEDFWRFLILLISLITFNYFSGSRELKKGYLYLAVVWVCYLLLALTSFNSTFFIFVWLIGLSAIYVYKNHDIKNKIWLFILLILFWASAPILGFALQLFQNISYLGWHDTWLDIYGAFTYAGNRAGLDFMTRFEGMVKPFFSATGLLNIYASLAPFGLSKLKNLLLGVRISPLYVLPLLVGFVVFVIMKLKKITNYKIPSLHLILLLAIAPLGQTFIMPFLGYRDNIGRLAAPFVGIIIGIVVWMLFLVFCKNSLTFLNKFLFLFISILVVSFFTIQISLNYEPRLWPAYSPLSDNEFVFSQKIKNIATDERAIFMINKIDTQISEEEYNKRDVGPFFDFYRVWEYYFDTPLLNFRKTDDLVRDLLFLEKRSEFPFTAIVTSDNKNLINELYNKLRAIKLPLSAVKELKNRYYFIVLSISKKDFLQNTNPAPTN